MSPERQSRSMAAPCALRSDERPPTRLQRLAARDFKALKNSGVRFEHFVRPGDAPGIAVTITRATLLLTDGETASVQAGEVARTLLV